MQAGHSEVCPLTGDEDGGQPRVYVSEAPPAVDEPTGLSRPVSATSSLDPYYFGAQTPSDSPPPPSPPTPPPSSAQRQPRSSHTKPPADPRKRPGQHRPHGPRWRRRTDNSIAGTKYIVHSRQSNQSQDEDCLLEEEDAAAVMVAENLENDAPDSPWTIEAVDGESDDKDEHHLKQPATRTIRTRRSIADESGGEEILYPRKPHGSIFLHPSDAVKPSSPSPEEPPSPLVPPLPSEHALVSDASTSSSPPSAFTPLRKARKRTSDEFEIDQSGSLTSKGAVPVKPATKDDKSSSVRRHRPSGSTSMSSAIRDKTRRRESLAPNTSSKSPASIEATPTSAANRAERDHHTRQPSASSSSGPDPALASHSSRVHAPPLPPSPSTTSMHHLLRHAGGAPTTTTTTPPTRPSSSHKDLAHPSHPHSSSVVHSLLRGTQEGWSSMDDDAHAEALRKLDGLSTKTARARASIGSLNRMSRPGTPGSAAGRVHWESGVNESGGKVSRRGSSKEKERKEHGTSGSVDAGNDAGDARTPAVTSGDEHQASSGPDKTPKKSISARLSFTPKRGSASSTTYTGTPTSSRDSASLSTATSATSVSAPSGRHSTGVGKGRRNSAGSDISSVYSGGDGTVKDRTGSLASGAEALEEDRVPPVPPLPKDLSNYRSPPQSSHGVIFPHAAGDEGSIERTASLEVPPSSKSHDVHSHESTSHGFHSAPETAPSAHKTPSKKWSFSNALNIKLTSSPSVASMRGGDKDSSSHNSKTSSFPLSPRSMQSFSQQLRKHASREHALSPPASNKTVWSPIQPEAMGSAASLASLSSVGSTRTPRSPALQSRKTPDCERGGVASRPGTGSSISNTTTSNANMNASLSPVPSIRRHQSKRLTPSSIPFFRRSSSHSVQISMSNAAPASVSPTIPTAPVIPSGQSRTKEANSSPTKESSSRPPPTTSSTSQKKSSVLSLGLPSLLKGSSSRRSLHGDRSDTGTGKEARDSGGSHKTREGEKAKAKQDLKDRSESRISVLMGRKRGKASNSTLSSTDPKKAPAVALPPMQMSALPATTAQRVASLKNNSVSTPAAAITRTPSSSRVTSQTVSSMQKQSDASLRTRNQLPTIAGSPSVGTTGYSASKEPKDHPPSALLNTVGGLPKETPTKIPRISSRTSAAGSPGLGSGQNTLVNRRISLNTRHRYLQTQRRTNLASWKTEMLKVAPRLRQRISQPLSRRQSARASPSLNSRATRQNSGPPTAGGIPRKSNRDSVSFTSLRKASTGSVASTTSAAPPPNEPSHVHHRFSALSPSKSLKLLSPKISLPGGRSSHNNTSSASSSGVHRIHAGTPSSSRQSLSTPSPVPETVDEEEFLGDEEMMQYIRRQQAKKMANGATQEELDEMLKFPEPIPPSPGMTPQELLQSPQARHLCPYEREEMLNHSLIYFIGAGSQKKQADPDIPTNNFGYDDDRGDYLVVHGDHLAYRYEVVDTLGKGSFGQVLNCRDHQTGESVAIKIIRNKKRFHHQALVEIKILDNLRKWDQEEKHHVIKMTEHFYFRNHLCIAMELLSINLYELIKANGFVGFTTTLIRRFTSQMILSLCLMRHHRIVHCDLKPENVLLKHPTKSAIKVIDFGSSCLEHEKIYTYIQSRFYRSPEVILGMNYHMAIDMWSLGCILAELYTGFPIFPGENEQEQLSCIMEVLGPPDKEFINRSSRKRLFFDNSGAPRPVVNSKGRRRRPGTKSLAQVLRCQDDDFVDFVARCLVWDPERRMKPQAALQHSFLKTGRRLSGPRTSKVTETPKKSQISAPTPLTARSSRTVITNGVNATPVHATSMGPSSRTYRSSQHSSSRTLGGFAVTATK
ncbi:hypothetical protein F5J12DRAFT_925847 [Pisolithus orientalis]|uniref:uncharacterized protein n=1 Tax=Pisolithus orientalis TaxID=936130 RepID=UPI002224FB6B|nr:uncharacterized protein F5J12DRAFT_925847 [Pisolithus orientalis]KAI6019703.1 hypothetical protein F5J12DRAFT_925847 [Pisolithus orientalis]